MKKIISIFLILCTYIISFSNIIYADTLKLEYDGGIHDYTGNIYNLKVNGQQLELPLDPIIFNDRALVPVREIFEELGANVSYKESTREIVVEGANNYIRMFINNNYAYVNGKKQLIPDGVVPKLIGKVGESAKTMVPVRFISETIGLDVVFDNNEKTININSSDYIEKPTVSPSPTPTPVYTPTIKINKIVDLSYDLKSSNNIIINVTANDTISDISKFTLSNPTRLVIDIPNTSYNLPKSTYDVNSSGISKIRLGYDEQRTRIVVDIDSIKEYSVVTLKNMLTINISTDSIKTEITPTPKPTSTSKPTSSPLPTANPDSQNKKIIVLDAGHGGHDGGAQSTFDGVNYYEKNMTLSIAKKVEQILKNKGYDVRLTRDSDTYYTLSERSAIANSIDAALFASIHINASTSAEAKGTEVYYSTLNNNNSYGVTSQVFANNVLTPLINNLGTKNRGVKTANHAVTREAMMPAILIEVGFISNKEECLNMNTDEFQTKTAQAISEGIIKTLDDVEIPKDKTKLIEDRQADLAEWEKSR